MTQHRTHHYAVTVEWTGNRGEGTAGYRAYGREHRIQADGKPDISGSADPAFLGSPSHWNPEELLLASVSACHKLWYLHLCADAGIRVLAYRDEASGIMAEDANGGRFTAIVLRPQVTIAPADAQARDTALALHHEAHRLCFIANSLNVPIACETVVAICEWSEVKLKMIVARLIIQQCFDCLLPAKSGNSLG